MNDLMVELKPLLKNERYFVTCNSTCKSTLCSTVWNAGISAFTGSESQSGGHESTGTSVQWLFNFQADQGLIPTAVSTTVKDE